MPGNRVIITTVPPTAGGRGTVGSSGSFQSSRRGSEDSLEETPGQSMTLRDLRVMESHLNLYVFLKKSNAIAARTQGT